jgi:hypothetical protein
LNKGWSRFSEKPSQKFQMGNFVAQVKLQLGGRLLRWSHELLVSFEPESIVDLGRSPTTDLTQYWQLPEGQNVVGSSQPRSADWISG